VTSILEGGVQRAGDRIRINVQLIDAATDAHVWADSYDRELVAANVFAIQSELAAAIAEALRATLTPAEQTQVDTAPTQSLEAWEAYQLGKQSLAKETTGGLADAERYFRKATELDARFALAWVGMADTLQVQFNFGMRPRDVALDEAEKAVDRALDLNPNLAEAWASLAGIAHERLQFERAEQLYRRAIALNANYAKAYQWLSQLLTNLGRTTEATATAERAVALDPLSPISHLNLGWAKQNEGKFDEALLAFRHALEIDPTMPYAYYSIAELFKYGFGRLDKASPLFEKAVALDPGDVIGLTQLAQLHWELGNDDESGQWLSRAFALDGGTAYTNVIAAVRYRDSGNVKAFRGHAQAAAEQDPRSTTLLRDFDLLNNDLATARARYAKASPALLSKQLPKFDDRNAFVAVELALVLQRTGEAQRVDELLDQVDRYIQTATIPRMGKAGYGLIDVQMYAIRGEKAKALAALREAEAAGYRAAWRYHRDFNPAFDSIRSEPEFKAVFADIERDMARQRAALAARPKHAPLDLAATGT
jgi:tetratricopeptide (TPR) repeat protein